MSERDGAAPAPVPDRPAPARPAPARPALTAAELEGRIRRSSISRFCDFRVVRLTATELRMTARVTEEWLNAGGRAAHGGLLATALDSVTANALIGITGASGPTVSLTVDYLRPVLPGLVQLVGRPVHRGGSTSVVDGEIWAPDVDLDGARGSAGPLVVARGVFAAPPRGT